VGQVYDGPLDLLLDLIRKQDIDIYDIPIARITAQFLAYVNQLKASDVDVAGEFIYTASLLIHIKSKMLLPRAGRARRRRRRPAPRAGRAAAGARALQERRPDAAAEADARGRHLVQPRLPRVQDDAAAEPEMAADTVDLVRIFRDILERARNRPVLNVEEDSVTVGQMIQFLARRLTMEDKPVALRRLLSHTRSERALIAMFLALLGAGPPAGHPAAPGPRLQRHLHQEAHRLRRRDERGRWPTPATTGESLQHRWKPHAK
jgi:segregation and condensation protein A